MNTVICIATAMVEIGECFVSDDEEEYEGRRIAIQI